VLGQYKLHIAVNHAMDTTNCEQESHFSEFAAGGGQAIKNNRLIRTFFPPGGFPWKNVCRQPSQPLNTIQQTRILLYHLLRKVKVWCFRGQANVYGIEFISAGPVSHETFPKPRDAGAPRAHSGS
jgi:hypothetical protein